jgi:hypothetical protein
LYKSLGLVATAAVLALPTVADAHTLRLQCKKITNENTNENIVWRAIANNGQFARHAEIQWMLRACRGGRGPLFCDMLR